MDIAEIDIRNNWSAPFVFPLPGQATLTFVRPLTAVEAIQLEASLTDLINDGHFSVAIEPMT